jgi:hypothetical protein
MSAAQKSLQISFSNSISAVPDRKLPWQMIAADVKCPQQGNSALSVQMRHNKISFEIWRALDESHFHSLHEYCDQTSGARAAVCHVSIGTIFSLKMVMVVS